MVTIVQDEGFDDDTGQKEKGHERYRFKMSVRETERTQE